MRNTNLCIIIQARSGNLILSSKNVAKINNFCLIPLIMYFFKLVRSGISGYDMKFGARTAKVHHSHFNAYKPGKFGGLAF